MTRLMLMRKNGGLCFAGIYIAACFLLGASIFLKTHHMIYTLDDPFIHLALAERIRHGLYGLNANEPSSPSSSIIWPFLLAPFTGTPIEVIAPLLLNMCFGTVACWLIGTRVKQWMEDEGRTDARLVSLFVLLLLGFNLVGLAFTGMEHTLQVLCASVVALTFIDVWRGKHVSNACIGVAILAPCVRYECLLLSAALVLLLLAQRRLLAALITSVGSLSGVISFAFYLHHLGLPPAPNSVLVKGGGIGQSPISHLKSIVLHSLASLQTVPEMCAQLFLIFVLCYFLWKLIKSGTANPIKLTVLCGALMVGIIQFLVFPSGWLYRYEMYSIVFTGLIAIYCLIEQSQRLSGAVLLAACILAVSYAPGLLSVRIAAWNIYRQQFQMHRLAHDIFPEANIAVNDIGLVSFQRQPNRYMLDLFGLSSIESARARVKDAAWMEAITRKHSIDLVMIYPEWFNSSVPSQWQAIAKLCTDGPPFPVAYARVMIYSTRPATPETLQKLRAFASTVPSGDTFQVLPTDSGLACNNH